MSAQGEGPRRRSVLYGVSVQGRRDCQQGGIAVAAQGVWSFGAKPASGLLILDDWEAVTWNGRTVVVVYDSDISTNPHVKRAAWKLTAELKRRGATPRWAVLPFSPEGNKQGVDDLL